MGALQIQWGLCYPSELCMASHGLLCEPGCGSVCGSPCWTVCGLHCPGHHDWRQIGWRKLTHKRWPCEEGRDELTLLPRAASMPCGELQCSLACEGYLSSFLTLRPRARRIAQACLVWSSPCPALSLAFCKHCRMMRKTRVCVGTPHVCVGGVYG